MFSVFYTGNKLLQGQWLYRDTKLVYFRICATGRRLCLAVFNALLSNSESTRLLLPAYRSASIRHAAYVVK